MPRDDQSDRLTSDLETMRTLAAHSDILEFAAQGDPPEVYKVTLRGRGISRGSVFSGEVEHSDVHEFEMRLGRTYPRDPPDIRWLTPVFHPNVSSLGRVRLNRCGLKWTEGTTLDVVCERLWDLVRGAFVDLENASDYSARNWFEKRAGAGLPVDPRPLRDPGRCAPGSVTRDREMLSDDKQLLEALVVLAAADGLITRGERGLLKRLAARIGVSSAALDATIEGAMRDPPRRQKLFRKAISKPELAMELLVAAARIDGAIDKAEERILVEVMGKLKIRTERFKELYRRGVARADALRRR